METLPSPCPSDQDEAPISDRPDPTTVPTYKVPVGSEVLREAVLGLWYSISIDRRFRGPGRAVAYRLIVWLASDYIGSGRCDYSIDQIAEKLRSDCRSVRRALQMLEQLGYLTDALTPDRKIVCFEATTEGGQA